MVRDLVVYWNHSEETRSFLNLLVSRFKLIRWFFRFRLIYDVLKIIVSEIDLEILLFFEIILLLFIDVYAVAAENVDIVQIIV